MNRPWQRNWPESQRAATEPEDKPMPSASTARQATSPWPGRLFGLSASLLLLWAVMVVHAAGQSLLAALLLALGALSVWTYNSSRSGALRWLLPGVAAALIFVVFPMLYTFGLGFTNYSARNLLDFDRARALLLEERLLEEGAEQAFSLHAQADGLRLVLHTPVPLISPVLTETAAATAIATAAEAGAAHQDAGLLTVAMKPLAEVPKQGAPEAQVLAAPLPPAEVVARLPMLRWLALQSPQGSVFTLLSLRDFVPGRPLYLSLPDGGLKDSLSGTVYRPDFEKGFFVKAPGQNPSAGEEALQPGFTVQVGLAHYARLFSDERFRAPFLSVFIWTVVFSASTVLGAAALGLLLAVLLNWQALEGRAVYRLILFLPYAVPGFISILVFKGLFNQNLGEINLILHGLFGIRPAWFSDPLLAKLMLLFVNIWLGFPYMMVLCSGLIQAIPADLYEASAVMGAGPWTNFRRITLPLILKPLTPLLISAFAFNFNNFVLISLLTGGRPDQLDTSLPAGTTDILVSYTWRIAFQDSGQQFGLAAAISTVIFALVAVITLVQMRFTKLHEAGRA